ncbi:MAG: 2-oxo acid dehydrogenase subunit E2 [SAR202 cluster bacterium]|nr:2-oxo acid dehydrogenase subunit E2 [SAR202 cluster bacterium]|tara:strand:+ start:132695 stop:133969 length:1275 start_codon:yes stop_codon:yes gene_type:complete
MDILLPQLGESITEGIIGKWLVSEGDNIEKYHPLVEVITDKVNVEMPSPISGKITKIVVNEGETVLVGAVIATIETSDQIDSEISAIPHLDTIGGFVSDIAPVGPTGSANVPQTNLKGEVGQKGSNSKLSPAVKKLIEKYDIDLTEVCGTGKNGRITRKDVEGFINDDKYVSKHSAIQENLGQIMDPIRKTIAQNMLKSTTDIPDAWVSIEADVTKLCILRESIKLKFLQTNGYPITILAFAIWATAKGIKENLVLNSYIENDKIFKHNELNMGVAVASSSGLIVPVIKNVFDMSVKSIAAEIHRLVNAANAGDLSHSDVASGTFTINNTGSLGSNLSKPIIVPGQAAIMTTEKIIKKPMVVPLDSSRSDIQLQVNQQEAIEIRSIMNLSLSFDHRIMDGSDAASFLNNVKTYMESFNENDAFW